MNSRSTYAFYGSLRQGMSNYHYYESSLQFLYEERLCGFQLYEMEEYPYAVKTGDPNHILTVEVFRVTDPLTEYSIYELELEVGYYFDEVEIRGKSVGIYLFEKAGPERLVEGGDWVKFFGS